MRNQTNEQALEAAIQFALTDTTTEALNGAQEPKVQYLKQGDYYIGHRQDYDATYAIDKAHFWDFLEKTQEEELNKLKRSNDWQLKILQRLDRIIKKHGIIHVLKKGLPIDDAFLTFFYPLPLGSSSERVQKQFESNQFSVMRQVPYSASNPREDIDMVLFINGLPIITIELKNQWTGQSAKLHGQNQYKKQRDTKETLLHFGRCMVHMAVDTDEVYMTTKLAGDKTFFLPFNLGHNNGKGNPPNPFGHKTAYLWNEVFKPQSLANIIQHFVRLDGKANDPLQSKTLFFPRYHQMRVVRKIVQHVSDNGTGHRYLIQHSAGSGKSNSITWAAYQLIEAYPQNKTAAGPKSMDTPIFDSVIVVTDRRLLDKQIRENIRGFSEVKNIVAPAHSSRQLRENLEEGKKIIITTIQKFPFIVDGIADLSDKRFAVIIDEAHSSQSGTAADNLNRAIGQSKNEDEDSSDIQDKILQIMTSRKMQSNASYLAFTATPKNSTLEKFGTPIEDGKFAPFDLYSMKQAIEEGFIHDVVANYTTYQSYYRLSKSAEENPSFDTKKAQKKLKAFVEKDQRTIDSKAEVMLDHFMSQIYRKKKLKGKAKAMIVTQSIESAVRYHRAVQRILEERGTPFQAICAFSGEKEIDGILLTEEIVNDLPSNLDTAKPNDPGYIQDKIARYFDMDEFKILVVANKYLTGFDQPKLCAMYVDKKLQGVLAVQALSRLNRSAPKLGKKTEDIFVLDFFNDKEDLKNAFDPYYTITTLSSATDVNVLHDAKELLDSEGVYEWSEVVRFNELFFANADTESLGAALSKPQNRFDVELEYEDKQKADYKIKARQFVKIYAQVAALLEFNNPEWEMLYWFLKFLIPKMVVRDPNIDDLDRLLDAVDLDTYGLEQRDKIGAKIKLDSDETELDPANPGVRGAHGENEEDELEAIIKSFNERYFHGWDATPEDQRIKLLTMKKFIEAHPDFTTKVMANPDAQNSDIALRKIIQDVMSRQRRNELELYKLHTQDSAFQQAFFDTLKRMIQP